MQERVCGSATAIQRELRDIRLSPALQNTSPLNFILLFASNFNKNVLKSVLCLVLPENKCTRRAKKGKESLLAGGTGSADICADIADTCVQYHRGQQCETTDFSLNSDH